MDGGCELFSQVWIELGTSGESTKCESCRAWTHIGAAPTWAQHHHLERLPRWTLWYIEHMPHCTHSTDKKAQLTCIPPCTQGHVHTLQNGWPKRGIMQAEQLANQECRSVSALLIVLRTRSLYLVISVLILGVLSCFPTCNSLDKVHAWASQRLGGIMILNTLGEV